MSDADYSGENLELLPETQTLVDALRADPTLLVPCVFDDGDPAYVIRQMSRGCVALRTTYTQPLCPQHDINRTPLEDEEGGDVLVVDLTIGGAWSRSRGDTSIFFIGRTATGFALELHSQTADTLPSLD
jgi:hypothetical protein